VRRRGFFGPVEVFAATSIANYDMTRHGRFIMLRRSPHGSSLRSVINWTD